MVVGDENPCREPERWRRVLAGRLRIPFWTVDADVVVPSGSFQKPMYALHIFKPKLYAELPKFLVQQPVVKPHREWMPSHPLESFPVREESPRVGRRSTAPFDRWRALPGGRMRRSSACTILSSGSLPLTTRHAIIPRWMAPAGYRPTCTSGISVPSRSGWRSKRHSRRAKFPRRARFLPKRIDRVAGAGGKLREIHRKLLLVRLRRAVGAQSLDGTRARPAAVPLFG